MHIQYSQLPVARPTTIGQPIRNRVDPTLFYRNNIRTALSTGCFGLGASMACLSIYSNNYTPIKSTVVCFLASLGMAFNDKDTQQDPIKKTIEFLNNFCLSTFISLANVKYVFWMLPCEPSRHDTRDMAIAISVLTGTIFSVTLLANDLANRYLDNATNALVERCCQVRAPITAEVTQGGSITTGRLGGDIEMGDMSSNPPHALNSEENNGTLNPLRNVLHESVTESHSTIDQVNSSTTGGLGGDVEMGNMSSTPPHALNSEENNVTLNPIRNVLHESVTENHSTTGGLGGDVEMGDVSGT